LISHAYTTEVGDKPSATFVRNAAEGSINDAVNIDANGPKGKHVVTSGAYTTTGRAVG
jgi:hypothetical protein